MVKFKKLGMFLFGIVLAFGLNFQLANGLCLERDHCNEGFSQGDDRPSTPKMSGDEISGEDPIGSGSKIMGDKGVGIIHLPSVTDYNTELGYFLALIKIAINWILGILASVALVYMLYSGFLVLSSGSDDKNVSKGKKGIRTAAIAIAGIGLAWLIISAMIWFIRVITNAN